MKSEIILPPPPETWGESVTRGAALLVLVWLAALVYRALNRWACGLGYVLVWCLAIVCTVMAAVWITATLPENPVRYPGGALLWAYGLSAGLAGPLLWKWLRRVCDGPRR